jgi:hypothetical protein
MKETVTLTPTVGNDSDGDPVAQSSPITLTPLEIAPGNMLRKYAKGGDLTDVEFTVYFPLRIRTDTDTVTPVDEVIHDGDEIVVRGRTCSVLLEVWRSGGYRGGAAVLARSRSGKAA